MVDTIVHLAWTQHYLRLLEQGVPETEAAQRLQIGQNVIFSYKRKDMEFANACQTAKTKRLTNSA